MNKQNYLKLSGFKFCDNCLKQDLKETQGFKLHFRKKSFNDDIRK
jgi:hypothetical protein